MDIPYDPGFLFLRSKELFLYIPFLRALYDARVSVPKRPVRPSLA